MCVPRLRHCLIIRSWSNQEQCETSHAESNPVKQLRLSIETNTAGNIGNGPTWISNVRPNGICHLARLGHSVRTIETDTLYSSSEQSRPIQCNPAGNTGNGPTGIGPTRSTGKLTKWHLARLGHPYELLRLIHCILRPNSPNQYSVIQLEILQWPDPDVL